MFEEKGDDTTILLVFVVPFAGDRDSDDGDDDSDDDLKIEWFRITCILLCFILRSTTY